MLQLAGFGSRPKFLGKQKEAFQQRGYSSTCLALGVGLSCQVLTWAKQTTLIQTPWLICTLREEMICIYEEINIFPSLENYKQEKE